MVIIEGPALPNDTAGWERCIATLRDRKDMMGPDEYAATMDLFQSGRIASMQSPPETTPGNILERLTRLKDERLQGDTAECDKR
jgi:hypothetical protein